MKTFFYLQLIKNIYHNIYRFVTLQPARNYLDGIYGETPTNISYPTFQPVTYSMNYISINDAYNISKAMNESGNIYGVSNSSVDSHLIKNSEWGACSYLSYSKYGTNGEKIDINNADLDNSVTSCYAVTGCTNGKIETIVTIIDIDEINMVTGNNPTASGVYVWNQKEGTKASSTFNMTGVYDLNGGTWEKTASYIANGHPNLKLYGESLAYNQDVLKKKGTKYTMVYPHDSNLDNTSIVDNAENRDAAGQANYAINKVYGDGIRETSSSGIGFAAWNQEYSYFAGLFRPFFFYSGSFFDSTSSGTFSYSQTIGHGYYMDSFRVVVTPI